MANIPLKSIKFPGLANTYTIPEVSTDLTASGKAAEAAKVGAELADIKADVAAAGTQIDTINESLGDLDDRVTALESGGSGSGLTPSIKNALLACFDNVAWKGTNGQTYYDALESALFDVAVTRITAVYTQSSTVIYSDDSLDRLKSGLVVTAYYDNGTSQALTDNAYTLSGSLSSATSIITATFSGKTATFSVSVTMVGSVNYADELSNWYLTTVPTATYSDGKISIKGAQSNANAFKLLCFDRAKTLWNTVNGKKLRIRVTMDSPDWVGDISTSSPQNRVIIGAAIYANATITTGNDRQKYTSLDANILPTSTPTVYEFIFDADISSFESGSGTPTSASTFGVFVYNASANRLNITGCSVVEVLTS